MWYRYSKLHLKSDQKILMPPGSSEHSEKNAAQMLLSITRLHSNTMFICTACSCLDHQLFEVPSRTVKQSKQFPHLEQRTINKYSLFVLFLICNKTLSKPILKKCFYKANPPHHSEERTQQIHPQPDCTDVYNGGFCN